MFTEHQGLPRFLTLPPASRLWVGEEVGGDTAPQLTQFDQRDVALYVTSCSAIKSQGEVEEGETFVVMEPVFQVAVRWWSLTFLEMAESLSADGKWWINALFCFACLYCFASLIKWSLPQLFFFLIYFFACSILFPHATAKNSAEAGLSCLLGLIHKLSVLLFAVGENGLDSKISNQTSSAKRRKTNCL